jgi:NAD(P)-dependent dehydrogenase (short-subunit alcohol dehydrogenase family)
MRTHEIFGEMWRLAPAGTPDPDRPATLARLAELTEALIAAYGGPTALAIDPLAEGRARTLPLDRAAVSEALRGRRVLVTGGAGGVGRALVGALPAFDPAHITSVDLVLPERPLADAEVVADVTDLAALRHCFGRARPEVVFHLAAQRLPGLAEHQVRRTVATNVLGTQHVVDLAAAFDVRRLVHASTGKAARYHTPDIYAGSKKLAEWMVAEAGQRGPVRVTLARFTHIVENSPVSADFDQKLAAGLLRIHDPDRVMYVQSMREAVCLLLSGAGVADESGPTLLTVRDLGWPVEVLRLALHRVVRSGRRVPLCFAGLPAGYERHPFLGQMDWSGPDSPHPMVNALETPRTQPDRTGAMLRTALTPPPGVAAQTVGELRRALANCQDEWVRRALVAGVSAGCAGLFAAAGLDLLLNVLIWGAHPDQLGNARLDEFGAVLPLLLEAVVAKLPAHVPAGVDPDRLADTLAELAAAPGVRPAAAELAGRLGLSVPGLADGSSVMA